MQPLPQSILFHFFNNFFFKDGHLFTHPGSTANICWVCNTGQILHQELQCNTDRVTRGLCPHWAYSLLRSINKYTATETQPRPVREARDTGGDTLLWLSPLHLGAGFICSGFCKDFAPVTPPPLSCIINSSLWTESFPSAYRHVVTFLLNVGSSSPLLQTYALTSSLVEWRSTYILTTLKFTSMVHPTSLNTKSNYLSQQLLKNLTGIPNLTFQNIPWFLYQPHPTCTPTHWVTQGITWESHLLPLFASFPQAI